MKRPFGLIALSAVLLPASVAAAGVRWRPSFGAATAEAKAAHELLFAEFEVPG